MIFFAVNQLAGKKIPLAVWRKAFRKIEKTLPIKKNLAVSLAVVSAAEIRKLNRRYRRINRATDVLSFSEEKRLPGGPAGDLGEIIICLPQASRQAKIAGWPVKIELELLLVHGFLHLLGYDHEKPAQARKMESLQDKILKQK